MAKKFNDEAEFYIKEYGQLIGKTVKNIAVTSDREFVGLEFNNNTIAWVQCDSEGNGSGFLAIEKQ